MNINSIDSGSSTVYMKKEKESVNNTDTDSLCWYLQYFSKFSMDDKKKGKSKLNMSLRHISYYYDKKRCACFFMNSKIKKNSI